MTSDDMFADDAGTDGAMDDEELLALLGRALETADPVPAHVLEGARIAFSWRNIDTELAQIVFDSARELAGVRGEETNRQLTFQAPGVEIEVMVIDDDTRRLVGQLIPPGEMSVELVSGDAVRAASTDRLGRFSFDELSPGPVRLVVIDTDGERVVQTEWVLF